MEQSTFLHYVLFSWFLWGVLFIVLGLFLFGQVIFDISIPFFKIFLALVLVYCGIWVLVCGFGAGGNGDTLILNEKKLTAPIASNRFRIWLSRGEVDLTALSVQATTKPQTVDVIFGWGVLMLDEGTPALVNVNSIYSSISMPGMNLSKKTGNLTYVSQAYQDEAKYIPVRVRVWFGELRIFEIEKKQEKQEEDKKPETKQAA